MRGVSPEDAAIDLVIEDGTRVSAIYFLMSDDNLRKQIALPYVSFGSDADSSAPEGVFLKSSNHPRAKPGRVVVRERGGHASIETKHTID